MLSRGMFSPILLLLVFGREGEREGWRRNPNLRNPMAGDSHRRQPDILSREMTKTKPDDSFFFFF